MSKRGAAKASKMTLTATDAAPLSGSRAVQPLVATPLTTMRIPGSGVREIAAPVDGARVLRAWQADAFRALDGKSLAILQAPTGSGKSMAIRALKGAELLDDPTRKVVIAVPQRIIAGSFSPESLWVTRGKKRIRVDWSADHVLTTGPGEPVQALLDFLAAPAGKTLASRVLLCTHQTLVAAHQKLMAGKTKRPWKNVSVVIDEGHHSEAHEGYAAEVKTHNRLGRLVDFWCKAKPGPLLIVSATLFRANRMDVIPQHAEGDFARYTHTMEAFLRTIDLGVTIRFLVAPIDASLKVVAAEPSRKTICYLPNVASAQIQAHGGKYAALARYQQVIASKVPRRRQGDLVTETGRDDRKAALQDGIRAGGGKHTPDWMWALNLGREGFDWPELERVVIIGARASLPDVIQMMGRALRPHGDKREAEVTIILPYESDGEVDVEKIRLYIKTIIMSMVVSWPLRLPRVVASTVGGAGDHSAAEMELRAMEKLASEPQKAADLIGNIVDEVVKHGDRQADEKAVVLKALKASKLGLTDEEAGAAVAPILKQAEMFSRSVLSMTRGAADLPFDVEVTDGFQGAARAIAAKFGYRTLGELREAIGGQVITATEDEVRAFAQGKQSRDYNMTRPDGYPHSARFPSMFSGKTFQEVRDGARFGNTATEYQVRTFAQGKNKKEYDRNRPKGYPHSTMFPQHFNGKSFVCVRDGLPYAATVSRADVQSFAQGKSREEYNSTRPPGYPASSMFQKRFKKSFVELRDGVSWGITASIDDVRSFAHGKQAREYDSTRPNGYPATNRFVALFGKTYAQIRDGAP